MRAARCGDTPSTGGPGNDETEGSGDGAGKDSSGDRTEGRIAAAERCRRLRGRGGQGSGRAGRPALRRAPVCGARCRGGAPEHREGVRRGDAAGQAVRRRRRSGSSCCAPRRARGRSRSARPCSRSRAPRRSRPRTDGAKTDRTINTERSTPNDQHRTINTDTTTASDSPRPEHSHRPTVKTDTEPGTGQ